MERLTKTSIVVAYWDGRGEQLIAEISDSVADGSAGASASQVIRASVTIAVTTRDCGLAEACVDVDEAEQIARAILAHVELARSKVRALKRAAG